MSIRTDHVPSQLSQLMTLTCRGELPHPLTRANQLVLTISAIVCALLLSSIWGIAAGSSSSALAIANSYKVPMVIFLSALTTSFATSIFSGTLVLATLAPLVAIYYHTSSRAGVPLALGSVFVALGTATLLFARAVKRKLGDESRIASLIPVIILVALFSAALMQFVALAAPIIGQTGTVFDGGFDTVFHR